MNDTCIYVLTKYVDTKHFSFLTRQLSTTELKINRILVLDELIHFFGVLNIFQSDDVSKRRSVLISGGGC